MLIPFNIRKLYEKIQAQLFEMIPEKWDRVYLYASVVNRFQNLETGEMFFYYYPKSVLKKNPINVYEIPNKFNVEEKQYFMLADKLYSTIKELRNEFKNSDNKVWSNITISIENCQFKIEYKYEDLVSSNYNSNDRHIIWRHQYLKIPITSFNKKEAKMIESYLSSQEYQKMQVITQTEGMYKQAKNNKIIEYRVERSLDKDMINTETDAEIEKKVKSQILQM